LSEPSDDQITLFINNTDIRKLDKNYVSKKTEKVEKVEKAEEIKKIENKVNKTVINEVYNSSENNKETSKQNIIAHLINNNDKTISYVKEQINTANVIIHSNFIIEYHV